MSVGRLAYSNRVLKRCENRSAMGCRCNFSAYFSVLESFTIFTFLFNRAAEAESEGCKEKSLGNFSLKSLLGLPDPDPLVRNPDPNTKFFFKAVD